MARRHPPHVSPAEARSFPVRDAQDEAKRRSRHSKRSAAEVRAFIRSKREIVAKHPDLPNAEREAAVAELTSTLEATEDEASSEEDEPPPPGGVGFGIFYRRQFRSSFELGTSLHFFVLCPATAGGNVSDFLYLTAANRASKGVEAFVSYFGQEEFRFKVYDWARRHHEWQIDLGRPDLAAYLTTVTLGGTVHDALQIFNDTYEIETNRWRNEVFVVNQALRTRDLVYHFDYVALADAQRGGAIGIWGPIVETFQDRYSGTNPVGFHMASLANFSGARWSDHMELTPEQTTIRDDKKGFRTTMIQPNSSWIAIS